MIKGKLVSIRNIRNKDLDNLYTLTSKYTDVGEFMPLILISETSFKNEFHLTGFWKDHCGKLVIEDRLGNIIGEIGCFKTTHYIDGREVYYRIFPNYMGKGYAKEALKLFSDYFFQSTAMNRLQAVTVNGNIVSEHILKKSGFKTEGTMRGSRYFHGRIVDLNLYSYLRSDWQKISN